MGGVIDVAGGAAGPTRTVRLRRIDAHALHRRQVDDQSVVDAAEPGSVVAAAANGDGKLVVAAEIHRRDHVGDVGAARDQQRPLVDHAVVELARLVVVGVIAPDQRAAQAACEFGDGFVVHDGPPLSAAPMERPP